jgi:hypothetical protein
MKCPIDQTDLVRNERQGVEIDYCPTCRGVWLDRGELDKIIEGAKGGINAAGVAGDSGDSSAAASAGARAANREWNTPEVGGMSGKVRPLGDADDVAGSQATSASSTPLDETSEAMHDHEERRHPDDQGRRKSRRSFLEELFDF